MEESLGHSERSVPAREAVEEAPEGVRNGKSR